MKKFALSILSLITVNSIARPIEPTASLWTKGLGLIPDSKIPFILATAAGIGIYLGIKSKAVPLWDKLAIENLLMEINLMEAESLYEIKDTFQDPEDAIKKNEQLNAKQALKLMRHSRIGKQILLWHKIDLMDVSPNMLNTQTVAVIKKAFAQFRAIKKAQRSLFYSAISIGIAASLSWLYSSKGASWVLGRLMGSYGVECFKKMNITNPKKTASEIVADTASILGPKYEYPYLHTYEYLFSLQQPFIDILNLQKKTHARQSEIETTEKLLQSVNTQIGILATSPELNKEMKEIKVERFANNALSRCFPTIADRL